MIYAYQNNDSYIRILHAVPKAPVVDVYANDKIIARKLPFGTFTEYQKLPTGTYKLSVYPTGKRTNPLFSSALTLTTQSINTIALIGTPTSISLFPIIDPIQEIESSKVCVRFAHLSPDAPAVDITTQGGNVLFDDVSYEEITDYLCVDPGRFNIQARVAGTDQIVLRVPNLRLYPNRFYTIYAVGLAKGTPKLQVLVPLDGNTYITF